MDGAPTFEQGCISTCMIGQALDGLCVGFIAMTASGQITWLNRAAQRVLGIDREECQGKKLAHVVRDPQFLAFCHETQAQDSNVMGEVSVHWPRPAELKVNATTSLDPSGQLIGRALLFCDVTNEKSVQVKLTQETTERLLQLTEHWNESTEARTGLTPQELRVLKHVGAGLSNEQIANEMHVAPSTVRSHLKHVYKNLGLTCRSEAISYALRNGLV